MPAYYPLALKSGFTVAAVFASAQAIEGQLISLPTVGTIGLIVFGVVWKLSKMLAEENAHTLALKDRVLTFEQATAESLRRIEKQIDNLPCAPPECSKNSRRNIEIK